MSRIVDFKGFGKFIPPHALTNAEVARAVGISEADIVAKTGIRCRYLAKDVAASAMGLAALREALEDARVRPEELAGIVVSTISGDYLFPNTASKLARELKINDCYAFDLHANCSGFQMAVASGRDYLLANPGARYVAVVGIAKQSPYIDFEDHDSAYFFGDAASATILEAREGRAGEGILSSTYKTKGENYEYVRLRAGGSSFPFAPDLFEKDRKALYYEHAGLGVWSEVIVELPKLIRKSLETVSWKVEDLELILFHQANLKLLQFVMARLRLPMEKTVTNVQDIGNTADASMGTALYDAARADRFRKPGARVMLASVGAGFVYVVTPYVVPSHAEEP